jgi:hypothetical protein
MMNPAHIYESDIPMKNLTPKFLIALFALALTACMDTGPVIEYQPVRTVATVGQINPESVGIFKGDPPPGATVIGVADVFLTTQMKRHTNNQRVKEVAAAHGANAVFCKSVSRSVSYVPYYIPPVTADMPQTSYTNSTSQVYSPYAGYVGSVNTTGTTTQMVPTQIAPAMSGVRAIGTQEWHLQFVLIKH